MNSHHLAPRLQAVAAAVPDQARLADIGSDHAYLVGHLFQQQRLAAAVIGEVAQGPLDNAAQEVRRQGISDQVTLRLADGLAAIRPADHITAVAIAGMGGALIAQILAAGSGRLRGDERLILQPNTDEPIVRDWLVANGYVICDEMIVDEGKHCYEILVAERGTMTLSAAERRFGPVLSQKQAPAFVTKWSRERERTEHVLAQLRAAGKENSADYTTWHNYAAAITEVLK